MRTYIVWHIDGGEDGEKWFDEEKAWDEESAAQQYAERVFYCRDYPKEMTIGVCDSQDRTRKYVYSVEVDYRPVFSLELKK